MLGHVLWMEVRGVGKRRSREVVLQWLPNGSHWLCGRRVVIAAVTLLIHMLVGIEGPAGSGIPSGSVRGAVRGVTSRRQGTCVGRIKGSVLRGGKYKAQTVWSTEGQLEDQYRSISRRSTSFLPLV